MDIDLFEDYLDEGDMSDMGEIPKPGVGDPESAEFTEEEDLDAVKQEIADDLASAIVDAMSDVFGGDSDLDNVDDMLGGDDDDEAPAAEDDADEDFTDADDEFGSKAAPKPGQDDDEAGEDGVPGDDDSEYDPEQGDVDEEGVDEEGADEISSLKDRIKGLEAEVAKLKGGSVSEDDEDEGMDEAEVDDKAEEDEDDDEVNEDFDSDEFDPSIPDPGEMIPPGGYTAPDDVVTEDCDDEPEMDFHKFQEMLKGGVHEEGEEMPFTDELKPENNLSEDEGEDDEMDEDDPTDFQSFCDPELHEEGEEMPFSDELKPENNLAEEEHVSPQNLGLGEEEDYLG